MKVLIVDDENKARRLLEQLLNEECPEITEVLQTSDLMETINFTRLVIGKI